MQIATIKNQILGPQSRPQIKIKIRKPETMIMKFLRKFMWLNKPNHRHSIDQMSAHLKRDMGLIEQDLNNRPRSNDQHMPRRQYGQLWL
uniref:Uncharacterized protein n=1 Tax=OCS116 cluster bacterium TaxID=2030921 RepID=A0A2A4ZAD7_9PROT